MFAAKMIRVAIIGAFASISAVASAAAIHDAAQFNDFTLAANDDGYTNLVNVGFNLNFFGTTYSNLYVNNNGNVTFNNSLSTFTPFGLINNSFPIIAPFFADVDTRNGGSSLVHYGQGTVNGRNAFGVNWINVGYFSAQADKLNSFQLILTDRSDIGAGDFDIEFNYDRILWETGSASGGSGGFGGTSAAVVKAGGTLLFVPDRASLHALAVALSTVAVVGAVSAVVGFFRGFAPMTAEQVMGLGAAGLLLAVGQGLVFLAFRLAPVADVAPFNYAKTLFGVIVGYFLFAERPDWLTLAGIALVVGSGVGIALAASARTPR